MLIIIRKQIFQLEFINVLYLQRNVMEMIIAPTSLMSYIATIAGISVY